MAAATPIARFASWPLTVSRATKALSVITEAMDRSMLPRPLVTTNIWPMPTTVRKDADRMTPDRLDRLKRWVTTESTSHKSSTPIPDQIQRFRCAQMPKPARAFMARSCRRRSGRAA